MLLGTLGASLLGNVLTGKGMLRAGSGRPLSSTLKINKGKGILRADSGCPLFFSWKNIKKNGIFNAASSFN